MDEKEVEETLRLGLFQELSFLVWIERRNEKKDRTEKARNEVPWKGISQLVERVDSVHRANMLDNRQKVGDQRLDRSFNDVRSCLRLLVRYVQETWVAVMYDDFQICFLVPEKVRRHLHRRTKKDH
jgi:hypothetical protein